MSPEQVQGLAIDHRSDIFSFGALLYELVTGQHPFRQGSPLQTMQRIVESDAPAISERVPEVPPELEWIVAKSLAKDPAERYQSSADIVVDLQRVRKQVDSGVVSTPGRGYPTGVHTPVAPAPGRPRWLVPAVVAAAILALAIAAWFARGAFLGPEGGPAPSLSIRPLTSSGLVIDAAISPDGKYLAYVESFEGLQSLWLKQVGTGSVLTLVPAAPVGYWGITFAPDGSSIYYGLRSADTGSGGAVFQVATLGGTPRRLFNGMDSVVSFAPDGSKISYVRSDHPPGHSSVMVANSDGSDARVLASRQLPEGFAPGFFLSTAWSRDGRTIYAPLRDQRGPSMRIVVLDAQSGAELPFDFPRDRFVVIGSMTMLTDGALAFVGSLTQGRGLASSGNEQVWLLPAGSSEPRAITNDLSGYRAVHATADGRALSAVALNARASVWELNRDGSDRRRIVSSRLDGISGLTTTPGGRLFFRSIEGGKGDIWTMASDGTDRRQLTTQGLNSNPVATRDEKFVVYLSTRAGSVNVWRMNADGSDQRQLETIGAMNRTPAISPDGRWVVFTSPSGGRPNLWRVSIEGGDPQRLSTGGADSPAISPDGKWVAAIHFPDRQEGAAAAILPIDGGEPVKTLPIAASMISILKWAPDGTHLIHTAGGGRQTIYTQALDGSPATPIVRYPEEQIFALEVLPDGRLIVVRGLLSRDAMMISGFR
jgi:eukaryotic-like serine/threonine-protein kinase